MKTDLTKKVIITSPNGRETMELREAITRYPVITKELYWDLFSGVAQSLTFSRYFGDGDLKIRFVERVPY
ncbi:MAG: hypothetical protein H6601_04090 [Flavobacteriales bacterium]|nr:hypothetical protein [Flavobacteriales bacterium]